MTPTTWCRRRTCAPTSSSTPSTAATAEPGCSASSATPVTPGSARTGPASRRRRSTKPGTARRCRRPGPRPRSWPARRVSYCGGPWPSCRRSSARRSSCASCRGCRTARSPPSPAPRSAPSCRAWRGPGSDCKRAWPAAGPRSTNVTCEEVRGLLSPYADGELDLVRGVDVERHLDGCPTCAAALEAIRSLSRALGDPTLYHPAPPQLGRRVRASLPRASRSSRLPWRALLPAVAAAAVVAVAVLGAVRGPSAPRADEQLALEVVASHIRSRQPYRHRVDVVWSYQHSVTPWVLGKVNVAADVKDLAA